MIKSLMLSILFTTTLLACLVAGSACKETSLGNNSTDGDTESEEMDADGSVGDRDYDVEGDEDEDVIDGNDSDTDDMDLADQEEGDTCISCNPETPKHCEESNLRCVEIACVDGCESIVSTLPEGKYGFCGGSDRSHCITCDNIKNNGYYNCDAVPVDGDSDMENPTGNLSTKGMRGYLVQDASWSDKLFPGEKRLSVFGRADGLSSLDIGDDIVAWCHGASGKVFIYRISDNWSEELMLDDFDRHYLCTWVAVADGYVFVAADNPDGPVSMVILQIDVANRTYKRLNAYTDGFDFVEYLHADHGKLVWSGNKRFGYYKVAMYDFHKDVFSTAVEMQEVGRTQKRSNVSDKYAVWSNLVRDDSMEIMLFDIAKQSVRSLTPTGNEDRIYRADAVVDGERVVWWEDDTINDTAKVYLHDLTNGTTELVDDHTSASIWIEGDRMVWAHSEPANNIKARIKLKDLVKDQEMYVTKPEWEGWQHSPRLSDRWLVYQEYNRFPLPDENYPGGNDVMLFDLCTLEMYKRDAMCQ